MGHFGSCNIISILLILISCRTSLAGRYKTWCDWDYYNDGQCSLDLCLKPEYRFEFRFRQDINSTIARVLSTNYKCYKENTFYSNDRSRYNITLLDENDVESSHAMYSLKYRVCKCHISVFDKIIDLFSKNGCRGGEVETKCLQCSKSDNLIINNVKLSKCIPSNWLHSLVGGVIGVLSFIALLSFGIRILISAMCRRSSNSSSNQVLQMNMAQNDTTPQGNQVQLNEFYEKPPCYDEAIKFPFTIPPPPPSNELVIDDSSLPTYEEVFKKP